MREGQFSDTQSTPPPHAANRLNYPPDITKEKFFFFLKKKKLIIFPPGIRSRAAASSKPAASWNSNDSPAFHQLLFLLLYLFILSFFLSFFFFWYCKYHGFNIFFLSFFYSTYPRRRRRLIRLASRFSLLFRVGRSYVYAVCGGGWRWTSFSINLNAQTDRETEDRNGCWL